MPLIVFLNGMRPLLPLCCALFFVSAAAACGESGERDASIVDAAVDGGTADVGVEDSDAGVIDVLSCGPDLDEASACGGDPVGTWRVVEGCASDHGFVRQTKASCPNAFDVRVTAVTAEGVFDISASSFARTSTHSVAFFMEVPLSCVAVLGGCAQYAATINAAGGSATCEELPDRCRCDLRQGARYRRELGAWSLAQEGTIAYSAPGGPLDVSFCVRGDAMQIRVHDDEDISLLMRRSNE